MNDQLKPSANTFQFKILSKTLDKVTVLTAVLYILKKERNEVNSPKLSIYILLFELYLIQNVKYRFVANEDKGTTKRFSIDHEFLSVTLKKNN